MSDEEKLQQKLNRETAKIDWKALEPHHQQGSVIVVDTSIDLIFAAVAFAEDNRSQVEAWLSESKITKASEDQAVLWSKTNQEMWAVVVAPWVLVQEIRTSLD